MVGLIKRSTMVMLAARIGVKKSFPELCPMLGGRLEGRGVWGRIDTYICVAESPCCPPKTTTLLIRYTPTQNIHSLTEKKKKRKHFLSLTHHYKSLCDFGQVPPPLWTSILSWVTSKS